jgi:prevent-host-death family protein
LESSASFLGCSYNEADSESVGEEACMTKRVSTAQAKAQLSALLEEVANQGAHYIIERRGRPVAALVSIADLKRLLESQEHRAAPQPQGALALVGAWGDILTNEEIDAMVADIYAARERDTGRPVDLDD